MTPAPPLPPYSDAEILERYQAMREAMAARAAVRGMR